MPSRCVFLVALLVAGCNVITPYKMDIQQGNDVTQGMIAKLQLGMTRSQVRFALGTPLVVDPFRNDRWDYVYIYQTAGAVTERRRLMVHFREDKLERVEGDGVPAALSQPPAPVVKPAAPPAPAQPEQPAVPAAQPDQPTVPAAPAQPAGKPEAGGQVGSGDRQPV